MSKYLIAAAIICLPGAAMAAPVSIVSDGQFSNLSSCFSGAFPNDCSISNSGNQVNWGFSNDSTLKAIDLNTSTAGGANVNIAQIQWHNTEISDPLGDLASVHVDYNLSITLGGSNDTHTFDLNIQNITNPPGDKISAFELSDLATFSFTVAGWTIDQLHYAVDGGTTFGGACGANTWCNPENNTGNLYIQARFTPVNVPEPLTLSLFGAGLLGLGALRRRKHAA
jgi:hypothetical protein